MTHAKKICIHVRKREKKAGVDGGSVSKNLISKKIIIIIRKRSEEDV